MIHYNEYISYVFIHVCICGSAAYMYTYNYILHTLSGASEEWGKLYNELLNGRVYIFCCSTTGRGPGGTFLFLYHGWCDWKIIYENGTGASWQRNTNRSVESMTMMLLFTVIVIIIIIIIIIVIIMLVCYNVVK